MNEAALQNPLLAPDASKRFVYSSVGLARSKQRDWQAIINDVYPSVHLELVDDTQFKGEIVRSSMARLELTQFITDGEVARRQQQHIGKDEEDYFLFGLSRAGVATYVQYDRECELPPDHFCMLYSASPYFFAHRERVHSICLKIPSAALEARIADPHDLCASARPVRPGLPRVTADLLISLMGHAREMAGELAAVVEANVLDMVGLAMGEGLDRGTAVNGTSVRWAIYRRAAAFMKEAIARPNLDPDTIAAGIGISTRYLHRVFKDTEETVGEMLMRIRLDKCRCDLADPRMRSRSIKEIAFQNGFKSQSHFASSYRARFGSSPKEARELVCHSF